MEGRVSRELGSQSDPGRCPNQRKTDHATGSGMRARLTAQGFPLRNPGGDEKQQSREVGEKLEVVVGGQSDCIDRIVGWRGGARWGKAGCCRRWGRLYVSADVRVCACMCMRVHVVWRGGRRKNGIAAEFLILPMPGPSQARPSKRTAAPPPPPRVAVLTRRDVSEAERDSGRRTAWPPSDTARNSQHCPTAPGRGESEREVRSNMEVYSTYTINIQGGVDFVM